MELAQSLPGGGTGTTSGGAQLWSENQTQQPLETPQGSPSPDNWHTAIPLTASQTHHPANMPPWPRNNTTAASGAMPSSTTGPHPGQSIPKQWRLWEWATSPMPADLWTVAHPAILHAAPQSSARQSTRLYPEHGHAATKASRAARTGRPGPCRWHLRRWQALPCPQTPAPWAPYQQRSASGCVPALLVTVCSVKKHNTLKT